MARFHIPVEAFLTCILVARCESLGLLDFVLNEEVVLVLELPVPCSVCCLEALSNKSDVVCNANGGHYCTKSGEEDYPVVGGKPGVFPIFAHNSQFH